MIDYSIPVNELFPFVINARYRINFFSFFFLSTLPSPSLQRINKKAFSTFSKIARKNLSTVPIKISNTRFVGSNVLMRHVQCYIIFTIVSQLVSWNQS